MIKMIVCVDENWTIGNGNDLIYRIPEDMRMFKLLTSGNTVVMGRKTFESIGSKPLPNRMNIVATNTLSSDTFEENLMYEDSINYILTTFKISPNRNDLYIIGGASLFNKFRDYCGEIYVTHVKEAKEYDNPVRIKPLDDTWKMIYRSDDLEYYKDEFDENPTIYYFSKYVKNAKFK